LVTPTRIAVGVLIGPREVKQRTVCVVGLVVIAANSSIGSVACGLVRQPVPIMRNSSKHAVQLSWPSIA
jgi:hypothetical protein